MSPTPGAPVPIYVGGHTEAALHRAARVGDGWTSAMMRLRDIRSTVDRLNVLREEYGRAGEPFEIQAVCIDRVRPRGLPSAGDAGVTDAIVVPWVMEGVGFDGPVGKKLDSLRRFADTVITKL